ncbi:carboxypeptidase-like regulatory domain-containing protein [Myroides marinus]|uniref:carboxypeptidase-like regulatory domain-containing protein n=1 Tax=Myroides marinus TaxID=703342 RepID=UPI002577F798|nr:carboxypeptidase-like regulatory domain-containing protein [Myroides marinus]MDM1373156.1 carboxypeptidase-like regulatory domain-containing protein [Myroides marinus]
MKKIVYLFLLLLCSFNMFAASRIITGVVTESGMPLPGVTVTEKGTQNGTQTDLDGKYRITIDDSKPVVLVFSFIGMKEEEVRIGARNVYNVVLKADDVQLDEVVVMGYADAKMINHIEEAPVAYRSSSYRELQGNVAGLKIQAGNSEPEGSTETWKKSTLKDNSMRLEIGDNEFLPLEDAQIAMQVDGNRIRVLIDAYFYNDKRSGLEGTFKLKLPVDASPYYFAFGGTTMFDKDAKGKNATPLAKLHDYTKDNFDLSSVGIQKREDQKSIKQARITEKQTAADAYFSTINRKVDPALMEWSGADMFSCRVFPLEANQLHHIVVGYDVDMVEGVDFREFVLSLPEVKNKLRLDMAVADNNQYVINPVKDAIVEKNNQKQYLTYFNPKVKEINVKLNNANPLALIQAGDTNNYIAGSMRISLPREVDTSISKDAVFMLDTSLSSNPVLFGVWVKLVNEILAKNETVIERFAILGFNVGTSWYQKQYVNNNAKNREQALNYLNTLALEGATDLGKALKEASYPQWMNQSSNKSIFLLSDGDLNWGESNRNLLVNYIHKGDKIYTYKTGLSGTNTELLDYLSTVTGASSFTANSEAQLIESAKALRYKTWKVDSVFGETVKDILLSGGVTQLYDGQIIQLAARGSLDKPIQIKASSGAATKVIEFNPDVKVSSDLASRIYGKIALNQLDLIGEQLKSAIVDYSIYYSVVSNYTSFLMLETQAEYDNYKVKSFDTAEKFVKEFTVAELLKEFLSADPMTAKKAFENWLVLLRKQGILASNDDVLDNFIKEMTDTDFVVNPSNEVFKVWDKKNQTKEEIELLNNEEMTFDALQLLAEKRAKSQSEADALKLLSSIIENNGSDVNVLRDLLTSTMNMNSGYDTYYLGQKILDTRVYDRLVYFNMARALEQNNPKLAAIFYYISASKSFRVDTYGSILAINGLFANAFIEKQNNNKGNWSVKEKMFMQQLETQVKKDYASYYDANYNSDLVVLTYWNIDSTDIDLHVKEASNEECYYGNKNTKLGGRLSHDVTRGFGPEMYVLPKAKEGKYEISLKYFAESGMKTKSAAKAYIEVYKYFGTPKQEVVKKTVVLKERKSKEVIETVIFK